MKKCPCGTNDNYQRCCGRYIDGHQLPTTPEALMRSRYTAYHQINMGYIADTMKSPASDHFDPEGTKNWAKKINWVNLEIIGTSSNGNQGYVEFKATYAIKNKQHILHEKSEFSLIDGRWYYIDGIYE